MKLRADGMNMIRFSSEQYVKWHSYRHFTICVLSPSQQSMMGTSGFFIEVFLNLSSSCRSQPLWEKALLCLVWKLQLTALSVGWVKFWFPGEIILNDAGWLKLQVYHHITFTPTFKGQDWSSDSQYRRIYVYRKDAQYNTTKESCLYFKAFGTQ